MAITISLGSERFVRLIVLIAVLAMCLNLYSFFYFTNYDACDIAIYKINSTPDNITNTTHRLGTPYSRIHENAIHVRTNYTLIEGDFIWSQVTPTGSMLPGIDSTHHTLLKRYNNDTLYIGDVIVYKTLNHSIIHRIIAINTDTNGTYYTAKGDNNLFVDSTKIRKNDIEYILVGLLY